MKEKRIFMKPGRTNQEDRMNFVKFWANFIRTHSDKEWSKQQKTLIDSQIQNAQELIKSNSSSSVLLK